MLPDSSLSSVTILGNFLSPLEMVVSPRQDFELGGVALNDPSQGLQVRVWTAYIDGDSIMLAAVGESPVVVVSGIANLREVSLAFDQNMRPQVAWSTDTSSFFRWYDTAVSQQVITEYPGALNLRLTLDDKRTLLADTSDVILTYQRNGRLYFRAQRDRYTVEYELVPSLGEGRIMRFGMSTVNRLQWEFFPGADPEAAEWPDTSSLWEVPAGVGFSLGERVGVWAERHGFLGFHDIVPIFDSQGIILDVPDLEGETPTEGLVVGYPYSAKFRPLPLAEPDGRGPMLGRKRRLIRTLFSVQEAVNLLANDVPVLPLTGASQGRELDAVTGNYEVRFLGWSDRDRLEVEAPSPYSATIRAISREYNQ